MGKKRQVKRPTEAIAWSRINKEAKRLNVEVGAYLRFIKLHGLVVDKGSIDGRKARALREFARLRD